MRWPMDDAKTKLPKEMEIYGKKNAKFNCNLANYGLLGIWLQFYVQYVYIYI